MFKQEPIKMTGRAALELLQVLNSPMLTTVPASPPFNYAVSRNKQALESVQTALRQSTQPDPEVQQFLSERQEIDIRHAKRHPLTKDPVFTPGGGVEIDHVAAWRMARGEHDSKNKDAAERVLKIEAEMDDLLAREQEVHLMKIPLNNFPGGLPNNVFDVMMPIVREPEADQ